MNLTSNFSRFSRWAAHATGHPLVFIVAALVVLVWAVSGPVFSYSDTWQLVINTGTTIVTFLMVFLIQSTQNRDTEAIHLKLDELIRAMEGAHNTLVDLEEQTEEELEKVRVKFEEISQRARTKLENGLPDTYSIAPVILRHESEARRHAS